MILRKNTDGRFHVDQNFNVCPTNLVRSQYHFLFHVQPSNTTSESGCWSGISVPLVVLQILSLFSVMYSDFNWEIYVLVHTYWIWVLFYSFSKSLKQDIQTKVERKKQSINLQLLNLNSKPDLKRNYINSQTLNWHEVQREFNDLKEICTIYNTINGNAMICYLSGAVILYASSLNHIVKHQDGLLFLSLSITATAQILCADISVKVTNKKY